ncbi:MAG: HlyD family efflux transporter periplasmic adaptor subunit [Burkholderiales bacterium]
MSVRNTGSRYTSGRPAQKKSIHIRRRPSFKFFAITAGFLTALVVLLILVLSPMPTAAVERASTGFDKNYDMLILRDEVVYQAMNYGKTEFIAREGAHVETGDPILKVYELGYNDGTLSELLDMRKKILDYEVGVSRAGVIDPTLDDINARVDSKVKEIQQSITNGERDKLLGLELDLESLLDERMTYLQSVVVPDNQLRDYIAQEQQLTSVINEWAHVVTAELSGAVSFYFDGCEQVMSKENIGSFTRVALEEVSAGKTVSTTEKERANVPLYRVVNENEWYVVLLSSKKIPEMFLGNAFTMVFDDYLENQYTGVVFNIQELEKNDGYVYTIQVRDNIGPLIGDRRVSARLVTTIEGLRIPKSCIRHEDGIDYVERVSGEYVPVLVIGSEGDNVFVQTYKDQPSLQIGELLKK